MPSFSLYGRKWHVGADDAPVFASFGVLFHAFWLVLIAYTGADLLAMPHVCTSQARGDIMAVAGLMLCFILGFILEVSLIYEGCKGTIFQLSKRQNMSVLVTLRFIVVALETAMTAYGTYVVFFTSVECIVSETEQWNPQREIMVLVIMTWVFQALTLLNAFIWYNAWPEHHVPEQWENRFMWIGRWLCCQPSDAGQTRQQSLRRIARWVTTLVAHVDLTASDVAVGLVLVATLQRSRRRQHLRRCIQDAVVSAAEQQQQRDASTPGQGLHPAISALAAEDRTGSIIYTDEEKDAVLLLHSASASGHPSSLQDHAQQVLSDVSASEPATQQDHAPDGTPARRSEQLKPEAAGSSRENASSIPAQLHEYVQQMKEQQDACITPSGMDQPLREALPEDEVVQSYTGRHWQVSHAELEEAAHFALYAEAAYGLEATRPSRISRWTNEVQTALRRRKRRKGRAGAVNTDQLSTLYERLSHEAIQDCTSAAGGELLYVSFHNQELAHLPYFLSLDHHTKSVVVAVRGTATMEDVVTDSVAQPEALHDWLPEDIHKEAAQCSEGFHAHGGIMQAAKHVLQDLDQHGLLQHLLNNSPSTPTASAQSKPAAGLGAVSAPKDMSKSEQDESRMGSSSSRRESQGVISSFPVSPSSSEESEGGFDEHESPAGHERGDRLQGEKTQDTTEGSKVDSRPAAEGRWVAELMNRKLDCKGWQLVVTGHSLGAGVATLIALALRPRFPEVHCYAFSPPGGMVNQGLGKFLEPFVTSMIVGKDMVPRMSMPNLARMIDQMVAALALCKHNKARLLAGRLTVGWRHNRARQLFWRYDELPEECLQVLEEYRADIETRSSMLEMVPPGRLIFLRPRKVDGKRVDWDAVWLDALDIIKEGILISPKMYEDHYLNSLRDALEMAKLKAAAARETDLEEGSYVAPELVEGLQRPE